MFRRRRKRRQSLDALTSYFVEQLLQQDALQSALFTGDPSRLDSAKLDAAIKQWESELAETPPEDPDRARVLSNLGNALRIRFERSGVWADLDRSVEFGEKAVVATPVDNPNRAIPLTNLCGALQLRFEHTGILDDLDRAIELGQEAADATPADNPNLAIPLSNLGNALRTRFGRTGVPEDADQAVEILQQATNATPADSPNRAGILSNLSIALAVRFEHAGLLADLDRAIEVGEEVVAAVSHDHVSQAKHLSNLSNALRMRFQRTGDLEDLDRAVEVGEQAVTAASVDDLNRATYVSNLGLALYIRFQRKGSSADLDRAVEVGEEALAVTLPSHPDRARHLSNLGAALRARYQLIKVPAVLDRAVEVGEEAVAATPTDHPKQATYLHNLGVALRARYELNGAPGDLHQAVKTWKQAVAMQTAPPRVRSRAAANWGQIAASAQDWPNAVEGYATAVELLALVAPRNLTRADQEFQLGELAGIASEAAACCLQENQPERAVELFEQGRGVLFSQTLDTRADLSPLAERYPELAAHFTQLRDELDAPTTLADRWVPDKAPADLAAVEQATIARRREAASRFEQVLAEIRAKPGFDRFLKSAPFAELQRAADAGPVVLVNVSAIRSDALLLTSADVQVVPLPKLSPQAVSNQVVACLTSLEVAQDPAADTTVRDQAEAELNGQLGWLWDAVVGPVLDTLGYTTKPDGDAWPRIWWCPSGLLAYLPLHAAGHHATRFDPAPHTVLDRVVSCYTPTIRGLAHARRPTPDGMDARPEQAGQVMVVAMTHTPGASDLPGAAAEAELVRDVCPGEARILTGPHATYDSVTSALPGYPWTHFACHGVSDLEHPSTSHLLLADHLDRPLTVVDVARLRLDHSELAFLSACSTARTGTELADEVIHLAAAFQLAGYRHVIATLWPIGDRWAVQVARGVYARLGDNANGPAAALHHATRGLRATLPDRPSTWAAHLYNGA